MRKKIFYSGVAMVMWMCAGQAFLPAQSAATMDEILSEDRVSFGAASYLLLAANAALPEEAGFDEAAGRMAETVPYFSGTGPEESVTLGEYAHLIMQVFGESGGLMYRLLPGPRYAARELAFHNVIQEKAFPNASLSGVRAVRILERFLSMREETPTGGEA